MVVFGLWGILNHVDLEIKKYTGGVAETNSYLVKNGDESLLIDASSGVTEWLSSIGEQPSDVLLTHQHYDHVEDVAKLSAKGVRVHAYGAHSRELTLEAVKEAAGLSLYVEPYTVDDILNDKSEIIAAGIRFRIEHIPGHSPDSIAFLNDGYAFSGDTIFAGSIGRADLPGGDMQLLIDGIKAKLMGEPGDTRVLPGHGPETSVAQEAARNPYVQ